MQSLKKETKERRFEGWITLMNQTNRRTSPHWGHISLAMNPHDAGGIKREQATDTLLLN